MNDSNYFWVTFSLLLICSFSTQAQDCFFETSYDIIEVANNGDGSCDYTVDLCAIVDDNAVVHSIEYSLIYDSDGDGDDEAIVNHTFNPGIQIPSGDYCLSASAPAMTFNISMPCGEEVMIVITGTNLSTNEDCINLIEDVTTDDLDQLVHNKVAANDHQSQGLGTTPLSNELAVVNHTIQQNNYILYPTLVQNDFQLKLETALEQNLQLLIADAKGHIASTITLEKGQIEQHISVTQLAPGIYYLLPQNKDLGWKVLQFIKVE